MRIERTWPYRAASAVAEKPACLSVVVVGGGPAGAAAAVFLRQAGHEVVLLDEARFPRDKVCGEGVSPEAWRLLARMGADAARARPRVRAPCAG